MVGTRGLEEFGHLAELQSFLSTISSSHTFCYATKFFESKSTPTFYFFSTTHFDVLPEEGRRVAGIVELLKNGEGLYFGHLNSQTVYLQARILLYAYLSRKTIVAEEKKWNAHQRVQEPV